MRITGDMRITAHTELLLLTQPCPAGHRNSDSHRAVKEANAGFDHAKGSRRSRNDTTTHAGVTVTGLNTGVR